MLLVFKDQLMFIHADYFFLFCSSFSPKFNAEDAGVDRTSFDGSYKMEKGKPL